MSNSAITNDQDVIDSRDIIERVEELAGLLEDGMDEDYAEEREEHAKLCKVVAQAEGYGDWECGETLIREGHFTDYIEELIAECYTLPKGLKTGTWPFRHMKIDYEAAAEEAKADYTEINFDGVVYLMRA